MKNLLKKETVALLRQKHNKVIVLWFRRKSGQIYCRVDASPGCGYAWQERDWVGPFPTRDAAIHAAFTEALQALLFRSENSWVLSAQPGERWQFNGGAKDGYVLLEKAHYVYPIK